jgi:hypothetical protein
MAPKQIDLSNWRDPRVGWGVILPDRDDLPAAKRSTAADAPESIQKLIAHRGSAPVFRYRSDLDDGRIRRYAADGQPLDIQLRGARGIGPTSVPYYLLIVGSPSQIPWKMQYRLQLDAFVGRLDLDPPGLERYVDCLIGGWPNNTVPRTPVIWATDHGHPDITHLMRKGIAEKLSKRFDTDTDFQMTGGFLVDENASHSALAFALAQRNPAFVMTSSHGATFPLNNPNAMRAQLGLMVDNNKTLMDLPKVSAAWKVAGGIWYAHACCSAGADGVSAFQGLVGAGSSLAETLKSIANVGACSAPLPQILLGRSNPARAFIGHVEPTFDWTLRDPITGQLTTAHIVESLYDQLHLKTRPPIGLALNRYFDAVAGTLLDYADAIDEIDAQIPGSPERARRNKLVALDRLAMVILGDPTVSLPQ